MIEPCLSNAKILIVDDDEIIRDTLETLLVIEGAVVSHAQDGHQAFDLINTNKYDVILSDIRMPGCSGLELLDRIRESKQKSPPIVLMSGFTDISETRAKDLGAKGMFFKTENFKDLKELLIESLDHD